MKPYRALPEFYDAEYEGMKILLNDVPFLLDHLPKRKQNILEYAVGSGRAAIPLAQAGHHVTGIDIDPRMLALAKRKRDSVGLTERQLKLVHADALTFRARASEKFDWTLLLFNTFLAFTTLNQQDQFLQNARRHLKPKGGLWIDIFHPDLARLAKPKRRNVEPHTFYVPAQNRTVFSWTDITRNLATQTQHITFHYQWFDDQGAQHHVKNTFDLTFIYPREFQLLLDRNGFKIKSLYGNYDGSPLNQRFAPNDRVVYDLN